MDGKSQRRSDLHETFCEGQNSLNDMQPSLRNELNHLILHLVLVPSTTTK